MRMIRKFNSVVDIFDPPLVTLIKYFKEKPEVLQEVLVALRKDKINKILNK